MFAQIATTWSSEFYKGTAHIFSFYPLFYLPAGFLRRVVAPLGRKLAFIYLANDIMQRSRRDGNEFLQSFSGVIADAIVHAWETRAAPMDRLKRMLDVWQERHVFSDTYVQSIKQRLGMSQSNGAPHDAHLSGPPHAPQTDAYVIPSAMPLIHPLASLLPPLSSAAAPSSSSTASTLTPIITKTFKDALPILTSIENSTLELEMLRDRVDMIRSDLVSGAEIQAKLDSNDAAGAAQLIHELDYDFTHVSNFQEAVRAEMSRRDSLIEALKSIVAEQESVLLSLEKEAQSAADLAIKAEDALHRFQSKKRDRVDDTDTQDAESITEPPAKATKLNSDDGDAQETTETQQEPSNEAIDVGKFREVFMATSEDMF
jgi:hypothetical protein